MKEYVKYIREYIGHKPLLLCGASIIIYKDNKVLLQLRTDSNEWGYHGGAVELDEVVEEAARRELFEETGLIANEMELFGVFSGEEMHHIYPNKDEVSVVDVVYICNDFKEEENFQDGEVQELKWFNIDNLPENLVQPSRKPLSEFVKKIKNSK